HPLPLLGTPVLHQADDEGEPGPEEGEQLHEVVRRPGTEEGHTSTIAPTDIHASTPGPPVAGGRSLILLPGGDVVNRPAPLHPAAARLPARTSARRAARVRGGGPASPGCGHAPGRVPCAAARGPGGRRRPRPGPRWPAAPPVSPPRRGATPPSVAGTAP